MLMHVRLARIMGIVIAVFGFWCLLHGGGSLLGFFGLERSMMIHNGIPVPTTRHYVVEMLGGFAMLVSGMALLIKVDGIGFLFKKL